MVDVTGSIAIADSLEVTDTTIVTATFVDARGETVTGLQVQWRSEDDGVVTVSAIAPATQSSRDSARLIARGSGSTRVFATVTHPGFKPYSAAVSVTVGRWGVRPSSQWPDTLTVTDVDTVELQIPNTDSLLAGALRVVWLSSNENVLTVTPAIPPDTANRAQMLEAKRRAVVTAHATGRARVFATVVREGFEQAEVSDSIAVDPLTIVPVGSWIDTTFVTDVDTFEVAVRGHRGQPKPPRGLRWVSSDLTLLTMRSLDSVRAEVTAQARGNPQVSVVMDQLGFEPAQFVHPVRFLERWKSVSAGASHTCGVTFGGAAFCWGIGQHGALGNGKTSSSLIPSMVIGGITGVASVSTSEGFSCAAVFTVYCWGRDTLGALGNGDTRESDQLTPGQVSGGQELRLVSTGGTSSGGAACAIAADGRIWCWGDNVRWQLGVDLRDPNEPRLEMCPDSLSPCSRVPRKVGIGGTLPDQYAMVDVGGFHTCGLTATDSTVFCWGKHNRALGDPTVDSSRIPVAVLGLGKSRVVTAGAQHTCAITASYAAFCWGIGSSGQLGNDATTPSDVPVPVAGNHVFSTISAGDLHTCALTTGGSAFCWGRGNEGQLGDGLTGVSRPDSVVTPYKFESISAGAFHTCGVLSGNGATGARRKIVTGAILCWGAGLGGRLGDSKGVSSSIPTRVVEPP